MKVPLLDLAAQTAPIQEQLEAAVVRTLRDGRWVLGPEVTALETELAAYLGVNHVIGCASGSDALLLALMALDIGPGDEVITTPFTFFATVSAITRLGARPVFADIDPATFNIQTAGLNRLVSAKTKAIIPVHLFGQCAAMEPLLELGIPIIEDACQAIGAKIRLQSADGRPQTSSQPGAAQNSGLQSAGAIGTIGTFSFYPTKNLGGPGDSGALATNDEALAAKLRKLRNHGMEPRYYHGLIGINSRLDSLQAAVLRVKLPHLDRWAAGRRHNAALYNELLRNLPGIIRPTSDLDAVQRPAVGGRTAEGDASRKPATALPTANCQLSTAFHVFNQYTIRVRAAGATRTSDGRYRDTLRQKLQQAGIGTEIYYPMPLHLQECFRGLGYRAGDFPESEQAAHEVLSLPIYPELTEEQIRYVASQLTVDR